MHSDEDDEARSGPSPFHEGERTELKKDLEQRLAFLGLTAEDRRYLQELCHALTMPLYRLWTS